MHHMDPRESSRLGDMRVNDVIKGIGGMKLSDVIEGIGGGPILPGSEIGDVMKRIEKAMPLNHVSITIKDLEQQARGWQKSGEYRLPRVPEWVRAVNPEGYTPKFICIGPYHRGENGNHLRQEKLKIDFLNHLREYCQPNIADCLEKLKGELTKKSRSFYLETFDDINDEEWAMMLLLDGSFFIMHLLNFSESGYEFSTNWTKIQVKIDLTLLENQLPFFILEEIFNLFFPGVTEEFEYPSSTVLRGMAVYFWVSLRREDFEAMENVKIEKVHHLVHLIHMAHCDLIRAEQVAEESWSIPLFTKIKKIIRLCPIVLMRVLTCRDDEMTEEVAEVGGKVKNVKEVQQAVKAVEEALKAGEKALSAMADAAAKTSEAAVNKKGKAAVATVEAGANDTDKAVVAAEAAAAIKEVAAEAAAAIKEANKEAAMAKKNLKKAKQAAFMVENAEKLLASAANKAEKAKAQAAVAKGKQKAAAMEKVVAANLKAAADAWNFAVDSAKKVHEAALKDANMAEVADNAAKAKQKAMKAATAAGKTGMTESSRLVKRKENTPSAMDLHHLGIRFVTTKLGLGSPYHVRISSSDEDKLVIPPVVVSNSSAPLLHNLIAFEQLEQHGKLTIGDHFTKYAFLMYNLIDSDEDISLLQRRGILLNNYGTNEQVISYFKNLLLWNARLPVDQGTNLHQWNCLLQRQDKASRYGSPANPPMAIVRALDTLEARTKLRAYRDWAEAKRYCNSPVQVLLLVTSILVFVSTILQTVTSISGR